MKMFAALGIVMLATAAYAQQAPATQPAKSVLDHVVSDIKGNPVDLNTYRGNVLLIVNVASRCGYTPQYESLEKIYRQYKDRGFAVLGFPANDFGKQEPGTDEQIAEFCRTKFDVTFPMFSKISAKGEAKAPLYQFLTGEQTNPGFAGEIGWNFTKFLLSREGKVVARFNSAAKPDSPQVIEAIEKELAKAK